MSNCGYFKIHKGKVSCTHPTYSDTYERYSKNLNDRCKICRKECGGIYPSQLPKADQTGWEYDVVVVHGSNLNGYLVEVLRSWREGDEVKYVR